MFYHAKYASWPKSIRHFSNVLRCFSTCFIRRLKEGREEGCRKCLSGLLNDVIRSCSTTLLNRYCYRYRFEDRFGGNQSDCLSSWKHSRIQIMFHIFLILKHGSFKKIYVSFWELFRTIWKINKWIIIPTNENNWNTFINKLLSTL